MSDLQIAAERLVLPAAGGTRLAHETVKIQSRAKSQKTVQIQPACPTLVGSHFLYPYVNFLLQSL